MRAANEEPRIELRETSPGAGVYQDYAVFLDGKRMGRDIPVRVFDHNDDKVCRLSRISTSVTKRSGLWQVMGGAELPGSLHLARKSVRNLLQQVLDVSKPGEYIELTALSEPARDEALLALQALQPAPGKVRLYDPCKRFEVRWTPGGGGGFTIIHPATWENPHGRGQPDRRRKTLVSALTYIGTVAKPGGFIVLEAPWPDNIAEVPPELQAFNTNARVRNERLNAEWAKERQRRREVWQQRQSRSEPRRKKAAANIRANWKELLGREDVLILDTETTGLDKNAELVEIALLDTAGNVRLNEPVLPQAPIHAKAKEAHGLDEAKLRKLGAKPYPEIHPKVDKLLSGCSVLLVYNAEFDVRMLNQTLERYRIRPEAGEDAERPVHWVCVMKEYAAYRQDGRRSHRLEDAIRHEGGSPNQEHRALADCRMTLELMQRVVANGPSSPISERTPTQRQEVGSTGCLGTIVEGGLFVFLVVALLNGC